MKKYFVLSLVFLFLACGEKQSAVDADLIIGSWEQTTNTSNQSRTTTITFGSNGDYSMNARVNYMIVDGKKGSSVFPALTFKSTWEKIDNSHIKVHRSSTINEHSFEILSVNAKKLVYEQDGEKEVWERVK